MTYSPFTAKKTKREKLRVAVMLFLAGTLLVSLAYLAWYYYDGYSSAQEQREQEKLMYQTEQGDPPPFGPVIIPGETAAATEAPGSEGTTAGEPQNTDSASAPPEAAGTETAPSETTAAAVQRKVIPKELTVKNKDESGMLVSHKALASKNPSFVGMIKIPGTYNISYNVVQAADNDYFLRKNSSGRYSYHGSIFMDYRCGAAELSKNTIIYGHNMRDGTMFSELVKFKSQAFASANRFIYFDTNYDQMVWEVFAAYDAESDVHDYYAGFSTEEQFMDYVARAKERSSVSLEAEVAPGDKILTLATCEYSRADGRYIVHAVLRQIVEP